MRSSLKLLRALQTAALLWVGPVACDSLTTPEERTAQLILTLEVENAVDPENLNTGDTLLVGASALLVPDSTLLQPKSEHWSSLTNDTVQVEDSVAGTFLARRVGIDTLLVEAIFETEVAGEVTLRGALPVRVFGELFLGSFNPTTARFGDEIIIQTQPGQRFSPNTEVWFTPNQDLTTLKYIPGFVRSRTDSTSLTALVPAGFASGRITLTEIQTDGRTLDSQITLTRPASDDDGDRYENNPSEPAAATITVPFPEDVLSIDIDNDVDFFRFVPSTNQTLDFTLVWNVTSNLNFEVYHYTLALVKVTDHHAQSASTTGEQGTVSLQGGTTYYLRIYAATFSAPTTYLLTVQ